MRSQEDGAIVMFGGTGTYTDENYSFHETLQLADFWFAWLWLFPSLTQRMVYLTFFLCTVGFYRRCPLPPLNLISLTLRTELRFRRMVEKQPLGGAL